jgi:hypothetical protein
MAQDQSLQETGIDAACEHEALLNPTPHALDATEYEGEQEIVELMPPLQPSDIEMEGEASVAMMVRVRAPVSLPEGYTFVASINEDPAKTFTCRVVRSNTYILSATTDNESLLSARKGKRKLEALLKLFACPSLMRINSQKEELKKECYFGHLFQIVSQTIDYKLPLGTGRMAFSIVCLWECATQLFGAHFAALTSKWHKS